MDPLVQAVQTAIVREAQARADLVQAGEHLKERRQAQQEIGDEEDEQQLIQLEANHAEQQLAAATTALQAGETRIRIATGALDQAYQAPAAHQPARVNKDIQLSRQAVPHGGPARHSRGELLPNEIENLRPIITRCWVAMRGAGDASEEFVRIFLDDMFAAGWTTELVPNDPPTEPNPRNQRDSAVRMGHFIRDCEGTKENPVPGPCRRAGKSVDCRVKKDDTRLAFDYVDAKGAFVKYLQVVNGVKQPNIEFNDLIENIHARALVARDLAEVRRFNEYNRKHFIYLAQMHLHHWFHVGQRFERVPNLANFEPAVPRKWGRYIFNIQAEYQKEVQRMLAAGDVPEAMGL